MGDLQLSPRCDHDFTHAGVVYELSEYRLPGSSAREVTYLDHYFCRRCLEHRYERLDAHHDSYGRIRFNARPKAVKR